MIQRLTTNLFLILLVSLSATAASVENHPSPYLNMHANDPVQWQVWDKHVLQQAKQQNKLIFISIGYFSCHWCHVMQRESYSDKAIGEYLNKHFVPVKVDRELRPQLDRRLINFVEQVRGQAGWPLNVFMTPDGYPVTGFTYLPADSFRQVLEQIQQQWQQRQLEISQTARAYFEQSENDANRSQLVMLPEEHRGKVVEAFVSQAMLIADELQGGFGQTTKFPSYPQLNALLKAIKHTPEIDPEVIQFVHLTLDMMASRHLMDHVNDGFYRYSTDPDWETPHFEKMLYDNAQLAALYLDADQLWPDQGYADIGLRTIEFMQRFLSDADGGYFASLSAVDSNDIEGGAYYWTREQLLSQLTPEETTYLLKLWRVPAESSQFQSSPLLGLGSGESGNSTLNGHIRDKLRQAIRPAMPVDTKKLASWNALVLKALVKAGQLESGGQYKKWAQDLYKYIRLNFIQGEGQTIQVIRFAGQQQSAETTLEDFAQLAHAIQLYALSSDDRQAEKLVHQLLTKAFEQYYLAPYWLQDTNSLIPGDQGELMVQDSVLESPVSLLLETLFLQQKPDAALLELASSLVDRLTRDVLETPYYYGSSILLSNSRQ